MARENAFERTTEPSSDSEAPNCIDSETSTGIDSSESTDIDSGTSTGTAGIDITCPQCGSRWTCGESADPTCPDCEASFAVRVRDEFALVERGGWTVAVSLGTPDWQGTVGDG